MTIEEQAQSLQNFDKAVSFVSNYRALEAKNTELKHQIAFFQKQLFGQKSEKRHEPDPHQLSLGDSLQGELQELQKREVAAHSRKQSSRDYGEESKVRFGPEVPVEEIVLPAQGTEGLSEGKDYEVVSYKETERLAQRPAAYVVLRYKRPVVKLLSTGELLSTPAPRPALLGQSRSLADVSLLAGIVIDKFQYYLPLYRQHQRMAASGVSISRTLLTNWVEEVAEMLFPVYDAQRESVFQSSHLVVDETPIKAGVNNHKMSQGWFWPVLGEQREIVFEFQRERSRAALERVLQYWEPPPEQRTLLSDGHGAYRRYAAELQGMTHAQCWVHTRRNFIKAEEVEPTLCKELLELIGQLYRFEEESRNKEAEKKLEYRSVHSRPVVIRFFSRLREIASSSALLATTPFSTAVSYALTRERELSVFLEDPYLPLDTNELERQIRPIPMGRKNWLFCWTEVGAIYVGILQSLISTCKLHQIDPYTYLVDILLRIGDPRTDDGGEIPPASELIPRRWKDTFGANLRRSLVHHAG